MSEGRRLYIDIIPRIDTAELEAAIKGAFANIPLTFTATGVSGQQNQASQGKPTQQEQTSPAPQPIPDPNTKQEPKPAENKGQQAPGVSAKPEKPTEPEIQNSPDDSSAGSQTMSSLIRRRKSEIKGDTAEDTAAAAGKANKGLLELLASKKDEDQKQRKKTMFYMEMGSKIVGQTQNLLKGTLTMGLSLVQNIYGRMKAASPLLQSVESLFQLAMTLFFMPLGNKLAEVMLPAVLRTLDAVMGIWDKFEGKSLGEMMSIALHEGMEILGGYINYIGSHLDEEQGLIGSLGKFLMNMGTVLMSQGANIFGKLFEFAAWSFRWFPEILGAIVAFTGLHYTLMTTQIAVTALASDWIGGMAAKAIALAPVAVGVVGGAAVSSSIRGVSAFSSKKDGGEYFQDVDEYAEGGLVPSTPGGKLAIVAEGGEDEWIIPESKKVSFAKDVLKEESIYTPVPEPPRPISPILDTKVPEPPENEHKISGIAQPQIKAPDHMKINEPSQTITNNFYIEGVTSEELGHMITDKINEQISLSRIRGGF